MPLRNQFNSEAEWLEHLRMYFAAKAMQATITALAGWGPLEFLRDIDTDKVAEFASKQADAMLAAREAQP